MGLMSGNPYYAGNGLADGINNFIANMNSELDRDLVKKKQAAELANQSQMLSFAKAEADRKSAAEANLQGMRKAVSGLLQPKTEQYFQPDLTVQPYQGQMPDLFAPQKPQIMVNSTPLTPYGVQKLQGLMGDIPATLPQTIEQTAPGGWRTPSLAPTETMTQQLPNPAAYSAQEAALAKLQSQGSEVVQPKVTSRDMARAIAPFDPEKASEMLMKAEISDAKLEQLKETMMLKMEYQQAIAAAKTEAEKAKLEAQYKSNLDLLNTKMEWALKIKSQPSIHITNGGQPKPMPASALKQQEDALEKYGIVNSLNADLGGIAKQIETGKIDLGLVSNVLSKGINAVGMSTEQSRNYATMMANLEKMRNDSLRLNKGVQTEGDAIRAWDEMIKNVNDPKLVKQRLAEIQEINKRGAMLHQNSVDNIRNNYNLPPMDYSRYQNLPGATNLNQQGKATSNDLQSAALAELQRRKSGGK